MKEQTLSLWPTHWGFQSFTLSWIKHISACNPKVLWLKNVMCNLPKKRNPTSFISEKGFKLPKWVFRKHLRARTDSRNLRIRTSKIVSKHYIVRSKFIWLCGPSAFNILFRFYRSKMSLRVQFNPKILGNKEWKFLIFSFENVDTLQERN